MKWGRLHNEGFYDLFFSPNITRVFKSRRNRSAGYVSCERIGDKRGGYFVLVEKPEEKRPIGRHRRRWENNIKMDIQAVVWGMDWIDVVKDRERQQAVVNVVMILRIP